MTIATATGAQQLMTLDGLIDEAWRIYRDANESSVLKPAIPILFFGDSERYLQSTLRIITVGLNPSRAEFPDGGRLRRFPAARGIVDTPLNAEQRSSYRRTLDSYFRTEPYSDWFDAYEPLLNGMGSSYYSTAPSTALHTDICSPLATDPTWSKLPLAVKARLEAEGEQLWHSLVEYLAPNLIIASVAREHVRKIDVLSHDYWDIAHTIERENPYQVKILTKTLTNGKQTRIVFGPAAQKPFGTVSRRDKISIGTVLRQILGV